MMNANQPDIQLLLREMADYPDNEVELYNQVERPYSRPMLANSHKPLADQYQAEERTRTRVYSPSGLFESQAASRPLEPYVHNRERAPLDAYGMLLTSTER